MSIRSLFRRAARRAKVKKTRLTFERLEDLCLPSFLTPISVPYGSPVVRGDFNNDGRLDLAFVGSAASVLLGNADGTFQAAVNSDAGGAAPAVSLATGDFDADGKLDLALTDYSTVRVLLGNGNGTFRASAGLATGSWMSPVSVAVGDFNSDGKLDLGVASSTYIPGGGGWYGSYPGYWMSQASVLLGSGTGAFTPSSTIDSYFADNGFNATAAVADVNNDGKKDFIIEGESGIFNVHLGSGTGTLSTPSGGGSYTYYYSKMAMGDINGDGKIDAVTTDYLQSKVNVLLGDGKGNFEYFSSRSYSILTPTISVTLADFNGDGKLDIGASGSGGDIDVLLGTGTGDFRPALVVATTVQVVPEVIVTGDFNKDGRQDLLANGSLLLNDGNWPSLDAPSISVNNVTVAEGNTGTTAATFTVSLSVPSTQSVTVRFATHDYPDWGQGGIAHSDDYGFVSGTLSFAPGQTTKTVTVPVYGDRVAEATESFQFLLSEATNAFISTPLATGTITDDEPRAWIEWGPTYVTEGDSGNTTAIFTVHITNAYDVPFGVNYSTFEGDTDFPQWGYYGYYPAPPAATAGVDYQSASGTLSFAPGETVRTIPVSVIGDRIGESDETFSLNLTDAEATAGSRHAIGIILDDEPRISINDASVTEGNMGTKNMTFTVTLSKASTAPVTVAYATSEGSAASGIDFQPRSGVLTFAPGETSKTFTVPVNGDRLGEYDEYFNVNLADVNGGVLERPSGAGTILDDEARLRINDATISEGNSGTKTMTFTVSLAAAYDQTITVKYATSDWSTTAGVDYVAKSGTLTFKPGETTKTITITIKGDTKREGDESFMISADSYSSNAILYGWSGWGTIIDDDRPRGKKW